MEIVRKHRGLMLQEAAKVCQEIDNEMVIGVCNGQCHCCSDTSECFDLLPNMIIPDSWCNVLPNEYGKGGKDAVKEGQFIEDDKCEYQDGDGAWQATKAGGGDCNG
jgi:hypothetical protein